MPVQGDIANLMSFVSDVVDFFRSAHEAVAERRKRSEETERPDAPSTVAEDAAIRNDDPPPTS